MKVINNSELDERMKLAIKRWIVKGYVKHILFGPEKFEVVGKWHSEN